MAIFCGIVIGNLQCTATNAIFLAPFHLFISFRLLRLKSFVSFILNCRLFIRVNFLFFFFSFLFSIPLLLRSFIVVVVVSIAVVVFVSGFAIVLYAITLLLLFSFCVILIFS